jgi:hypothetical protein
MHILMPDIVAKGRKPKAIACHDAHWPGLAENSPLRRRDI